MSDELQVWTGAGEFFPMLEVRALGENLFRVSATRTSPSKYLDYSTIIEVDSMEDAIAHLQGHDYSYFSEVTLYGEEG